MTHPMFDLPGKVAVVSGAAQGMGQATAIAVAECGADVALVDRNVDGAEAAAEQIRTLCRNVLVDEVFGPCSVASEIAARIADAGFDELDAPIKCLTGSFTPTPYAPTLEAAIVPQVVDVENAIRDLLAE
ncbi:MAG: SDR family NAD(P)-dependent oxidoreductase [Planctomycetota bacterium]|nr:SDR family NAD(P)-dependent oxidoreductase [Planctomycetota bacterium]